MKLSTNILFQLAAIVIQYGNMASGLFPVKFQAPVALVIGLAQALVAWKSHYTNVDGTPQSVGFIKK